MKKRIISSLLAVCTLVAALFIFPMSIPVAAAATGQTAKIDFTTATPTSSNLTVLPLLRTTTSSFAFGDYEGNPCWVVTKDAVAATYLLLKLGEGFFDGYTGQEVKVEVEYYETSNFTVTTKYIKPDVTQGTAEENVGLGHGGSGQLTTYTATLADGVSETTLVSGNAASLYPESSRNQQYHISLETWSQAGAIGSIYIKSIQVSWGEPSTTDPEPAETPYIIETPEQLSSMNGSNHYKLGKDIVLTEAWTPIATFAGTLDGDGHSISGLKIEKAYTAGDAYVGLFSQLTEGAVVKNLTMVNVDINVTKDGTVDDFTYVGAVAGRATKATIDNCSVSGSLYLSSATTTTEYNRFASVGGVVGGLDGATVMNCVNSASVEHFGNISAEWTTSTNNFINNAGGLVGLTTNGAKVMNSANLGSVKTSGTHNWARTGGLVGYMLNKDDTVVNSYNAGAVTGSTAGMIAGRLDGGDSILLTHVYYVSGTAVNQGTMAAASTVTAVADMKTPEFVQRLNANRGENRKWYCADESAPMLIGSLDSGKFGVVNVSLTEVLDLNFVVPDSYTTDFMLGGKAVAEEYRGIKEDGRHFIKVYSYEMDELVVATLKNSSGEIVDQIILSMNKHLDDVKKSDASTADVVDALKAYGVHSKNYKDNTSAEAPVFTLDPANKPADISVSVDPVRESPYGITPTLALNNACHIRLIVKTDYKDYLLNGAALCLRADGKYDYTSDAIHVTEWGTTQNYTLTNGTETFTISISPLAYIYRVLSGENTAKEYSMVAAMYNYYVAAVAYCQDSSN